MRVVFMGFRGWGLPALEAALDDHQVSAIITHPEEIESFNVAFSESVQEFGASRGIPTFVSKKAQEESIWAAVEACEPDIILSSNWRRRIAPGLLRLARFGGINVHRSLLPKYAGFAPVNWAIAMGEKITGVTLHTMTDGIDAGEIISQESLEIAGDDTATTVFHKMIPVVRRLVKSGLRQIESGTASPRPQGPGQIEYFPKRTEYDLRIDWRRTCTQILNLIRAQSAPFPAAFTSWNGTRIDIVGASPAGRCYRGTPGRVVEVGPSGIVVLCGESNGSRQQGLLVTSVSIAGSAPSHPRQVIRSTTENFV